MKKKIEINSKIKKRLKLILSNKPDSYWVDILGTTRSNVWGWKNNQFPNSNYLIKILEISETSADWLFFGVGDKGRSNKKTTNNMEIVLAERVLASNLISEIELEKLEIEEHLKKIKASKWVIELVKNCDSITDDDALSNILENLISPALKKLENRSGSLVNKLNAWLKTDEGKTALQKFLSLFR